MILTAYFDESGTHGGEIALMAGHIGNARGWRSFEKRTARLFKRYKVDIFHTIDVKRTDGDFEGWKIDRKIKFLDEFLHIANETTEAGFASILRYDDYAHYKALNWPKGTRPQSMYALMYRVCLSASLKVSEDIAGTLASNAHMKVNVVLESGHRNAPEAIDFHNSIRAGAGEASHFLAELSFGLKGKSLPLAAADLFAYSVYQEEIGGKPIGNSKTPLKAEASYRKNLYRLAIDRKSLMELHQEAISRARDARKQPS